MSLDESPGRVLARDVTSDTDLPPFDRAAMDGFAVRWQDTEASPVTLALAGIVQAGHIPSRSLRAGEAAGIMTGAPVPPGADAVVPVEQARSLGHDRVEILACARAGQHVAERGCEVRTGDTVLRTGVVIDPAAVAVLASVGCVRVPVGRRPRVGLLSSGDEIVDAAEVAPPGCIRDANSAALGACIRRAGGIVVPLGMVRDRASDLELALRADLDVDAIVTSGGVSEGLFDLVEPALERTGARFHFTRVAIRPGAPFAFGSRGATLVFALPGNPVSAQVTFELFVRPALRFMQGASPAAPVVPVRLQAPLANQSVRQAYVPVRLGFEAGALGAWPLPSKGSADVVTHAAADGLAILEPRAGEVGAGEVVPVWLLPRFAGIGGT